MYNVWVQSHPIICLFLLLYISLFFFFPPLLNDVLFKRKNLMFVISGTRSISPARQMFRKIFFSGLCILSVL